ncbi:MAG: hypothetical protein V4555_20085 [Acidobacteriota bacterium]
MARAIPSLPRKFSLIFPVSLLCASILAGCGVGPVATSVSGHISVSGIVHGGQQPVTGSSIMLFTAGTGGNGSIAHSMLVAPRSTNSIGYFDITSDYTCTHPNDQVYIVSAGGDSGSGTPNNALVMIDALGTCSNLLTSGYYITINEITTVAAAYALAPFMTSYDHVGASATNATGLANAFLNAHLLADPESGQIPTLAANQTVESQKLLALADVIAPCVNSDGTTGCSALFSAATPSGGSAPTDSLTAALNIVKHPANNVTAVFNCINAKAPFATTQRNPPNDWTMSLTVTAHSLFSPTALSIDSAGNVWVVGQNTAAGNVYPNGIMHAFSPQGIPFSSTGYGIGTLYDSFGVTVDPNGNVWVPNWDNFPHNGTTGSLSIFTGSNNATPGAIIFASIFDNSLDYPQGIAADALGNIFIGDYGNSTATIYKDNATFISGGLAFGASAFPTFVAADGSGGFWMANSGDNTITHVASGGATFQPACCAQTYGVAVDSSGNAWTANYGSNSVSEVSSTGTIVLNSVTGGGVVSPSAVTVDAGNNIWLTNYRATHTNGTISELAGNSNTLPAGTGISPVFVSATVPGGYGLDAKLVIPNAIRPDASGNLWIANDGGNDVVMFFGLATPTATPLLGLPKAP